jgi:hypothetical protein
MLPNPIDLSPDLQQLRREGYEITIKEGFLLASHIPYVNAAKQISFGVLASELTHTNGITQTNPPHTIFFQGDHPCDRDGNILTAIKHSSANQSIFKDFAVQHMFSNKPAKGYANYYEKIYNYVGIISAPAIALDDSVSAETFRVPDSEVEESVFQYSDTNSARANFNPVSDRLRGQKIAIIGMGGTGSYILDFVAKCPVAEIHLFDADPFCQHNAFRVPGAASAAELDENLKKVNYLARLYTKIHKHIIPHDSRVTADSFAEFAGLSYVFIAIDKGQVKPALFNYLIAQKIPLIDVGIGVERKNDFLVGIVRVTTGTYEKNDHLLNRISVADDDDDLYDSNIQIAELNALNAAFAVIKWKQMSGFYADGEKAHHLQYSINFSQLLHADT